MCLTRVTNVSLCVSVFFAASNIEFGTNLPQTESLTENNDTLTFHDVTSCEFVANKTQGTFQNLTYV